MTAPMDFEYHRPGNLVDALALLASLGADARVIAGGTDLVPQMRAGKLRPGHLISVNGLAQMATLRQAADGSLHIGAGVRIADVGADPQVQQRWPGLAYACTVMATTQVRHMGTLAGNLCNGSPCADTAASLLVADAGLDIASADGRRIVAMADFYRGPKDVDLAVGELLVGIRLPPPPPRSGACYMRISARSLVDMAAAGVAVRLSLAEDGTISHARLAMSAVGPTPLLCPAAEALLVGNRPEEALFAAAASAAMAASRPIDDVRSSAAWRRAMVGVLSRRALARSVEIAAAPLERGNAS